MAESAQPVLALTEAQPEAAAQSLVVVVAPQVLLAGAQPVLEHVAPALQAALSQSLVLVLTEALPEVEAQSSVAESAQPVLALTEAQPELSLIHI